MNAPTRINITWHEDESEYRVDISNWDGAEVVLASEYDKAAALVAELTDALNKARLENDRLNKAIGDAIETGSLTFIYGLHQP